MMRTLLIADIHANLAALDALPHADRIICAGDLVVYGPHPSAVIKWLRKARAVCVRGDEDDAVAHAVEHVAPPEFGNACLESRTWTRGALDPSDIGFLRSLPPESEIDLDGTRIGVTHAYPGDYARYIEPTDEQLGRIARAFPQARLIVLGHTHRVGIWTVGRTVIVNPGSVGQPLHPGQASFAVLEDGVVRLDQVRFDLYGVVQEVSTLPLSELACEESKSALLQGARRPHDRVAQQPPGTRLRIL